MKFIGLEVQAERLRLVQTTRAKTNLRIDYVGEKLLPAEWGGAGKITNWEGVCSVLTAWLHELGMCRIPAAISLPAHLVRMQRLQVPRSLAHQETLQAIQAQVARDLFVQNAALAIDYVVEEHCTDIQFVATPQDYLNQLVACITSAGLIVKIVDVDCYALERALCFKEIWAGAGSDEYLVAYGLALRETPLW